MILVFGGDGQLGRALRAEASGRDVVLRGLSRAEADIADPAGVETVLARHRPDVVVNAAAYTRVDAAEGEPEAAERTNAIGPGVLAAATGRAGIPLIHISTDYVFDGTKPGAYREDDPAAPLGVYGRTKAAGEAVVRERAERHLILRTAWLFGATGQNFVRTVLRLAATREELRVVADQRGSPTAADDLAAAVLAAAAAAAAGTAPWGTYHVAGAGETTWHGLAERIVAAQAPVTGRRPPVAAIATADFPTAARRPANSVLDSSRFAAAFGTRPGPWQAAVDRTVGAILASTETTR